MSELQIGKFLGFRLSLLPATQKACRQKMRVHTAWPAAQLRVKSQPVVTASDSTTAGMAPPGGHLEHDNGRKRLVYRRHTHGQARGMSAARGETELISEGSDLSLCISCEQCMHLSCGACLKAITCRPRLVAIQPKPTECSKLTAQTPQNLRNPGPLKAARRTSGLRHIGDFARDRQGL